MRELEGERSFSVEDMIVYLENPKGSSKLTRIIRHKFQKYSVCLFKKTKDKKYSGKLEMIKSESGIGKEPMRNSKNEKNTKTKTAMDWLNNSAWLEVIRKLKISQQTVHTESW